MTQHHTRLNNFSHMMKKGRGMTGKGLIIPFKLYNKQRNISEEKEEQKYMKKNDMMRGDGLTRIKPLKFNY